MTTSDILPCNKRKILIVDDEQSVLNTLRTLLNSKFPDHQLDLAGNGIEAVESFQSEHQAVLVMDLHMPEMDGLTAFSELEKHCEINNWETPSVIFCTGFDPPDGVNKIVADNPKHCLLLKPLDSKSLYTEIENRCS